MTSLTVKIGFSLIVLFGLGVSTGVVVGKYTDQPLRPATTVAAPVEERWLNARVDEYKTKLKLTPQQVAAVRPHFEKMRSELRQIRAEVRARSTAAYREANTQISRELTPEQREKLTKILREKSRDHANTHGEGKKKANSGRIIGN